MSTLVACGPNAFGYGVRFQEVDNTDDFEWPLVEQSGDTWAPGTFVGARGRGGILVEVALPDSDLAAQILASVQVNERLDPNGCPVDSSSDPVVPGDTMTVCRYDDAGLLEQSELLSGADLKAAELALWAAPDASTPGPATRSPVRPSVWPRWPRTPGSISAAARSWCTVRLGS